MFRLIGFHGTRVLRGPGLRALPPRLLGCGSTRGMSTGTEAPAKEVPASGQPAWEPVRLWEINTHLHDFIKDAHRREVDLVRQIADHQGEVKGEITMHKNLMKMVMRDLSLIIAALMAIVGVGAYVIEMWERRLPAAVIAILVEKNMVPTPPLAAPTENPPAKT
ncbi:hypothetical protein HOY80DRAFT_989705 [Tuber brumale]|nr:hypothetical protein HOY80DRAFT_989705 [Tuber brumale]